MKETNITVLLCHCSRDGQVVYSKQVVNLDMPTLKKLVQESSLLIFEKRDNDPNEIILDVYAK